jgi:hypothetical protein
MFFLFVWYTPFTPFSEETRSSLTFEMSPGLTPQLELLAGVSLLEAYATSTSLYAPKKRARRNVFAAHQSQCSGNEVTRRTPSQPFAYPEGHIILYVL